MFKLGRELLGGRGIRKHGRAILAGLRLVAEVLAQAPGHVEAWLTGSAGPPPPRADLLWYRLADELFRELDSAGTHAPLLLVKVPELSRWSDDDPWPVGCTLFVPFQDPENVGAVIRSAVAFGVAQVVLLRESAHPFHPRSSRAAGPALFQVPLRLGPSLQELQTRGGPLIALATEGPELSVEPWPERFGLVAGIEGPGLPPALREGPRRRIAIAPGVESLNAATAIAIALYAWRQGTGRKQMSDLSGGEPGCLGSQPEGQAPRD
jgi:16S rRNA (guanine527-N7)-methyltransferase